MAAAAQRLFTLVTQLRGSRSHPDLEELLRRVKDEVRDFREHVSNIEVDRQVCDDASYALCALVDETVLETPWGSESVWNRQGTLVEFHKEAWGGEEFFNKLDWYRERDTLEPKQGRLHLLEVMYICLALGFRGQYTVRADGRRQLEEQRKALYEHIRRRRGEYEKDLSRHWRGASDWRHPLVRNIPLWVVSSSAAALLTLLFLVLSHTLSEISTPVHAALLAADQALPRVTIDRPRAREPRPTLGQGGGAETPPPPLRPPPKVPTLRGLLGPEIQRGELSVTDILGADGEPGGEKVLIHADGLFKLGRDVVAEEYDPLLRRIALALGEVPGRVLVTGHTDNVPMKANARFPSNWHLSQARADRVASKLAAIVGEPARFTAEGRGEAEPLDPKVDNTLPQNQARNRRVEIILVRPSVPLR